MNIAFLVAILVTSILVFVDARLIGVRKEQGGGLLNMGPWGWLFVCLGLWVIGFPAYLIRRRKYKKQTAITVLGFILYTGVIGSPIYAAMKMDELPVIADKGNMAGYSLDVCGDEKLTQVTSEKIDSALKQLAAGKCTENAFVILDRTSGSYMQTFFDATSGEFTLEYQEGDLSKHFAAKNADLSVDKIIWAFTEYLNGSDSWKTGLAWEKVNVQDNSDVSGEGSLEEFKVGDTLKAGYVELQVTSTSLEKSVGDSFTKVSSAEGGVFVVVNWTYKNISGKPLSAFKQPSINLVDPNGTVYNKDINATTYYDLAENIDEKVLSDLNPDIKVKAAAVFEVSEALFNDGWKIKIDGTQISFKKNAMAPEPSNDQAKSAAGWSEEFKQGVMEGCVGKAANNQTVHAICSCSIDQASTELTESQIANIKTDPAVQEKINSVMASCKARVMADTN